eukprot:gene5891-6815_t
MSLYVNKCECNQACQFKNSEHLENFSNELRMSCVNCEVLSGGSVTRVLIAQDARVTTLFRVIGKYQHEYSSPSYGQQQNQTSSQVNYSPPSSTSTASSYYDGYNTPAATNTTTATDYGYTPPAAVTAATSTDYGYTAPASSTDYNYSHTPSVTTTPATTDYGYTPPAAVTAATTGYQSNSNVGYLSHSQTASTQQDTSYSPRNSYHQSYSNLGYDAYAQQPQPQQQSTGHLSQSYQSNPNVGYLSHSQTSTSAQDTSAQEVQEYWRKYYEQQRQYEVEQEKIKAEEAERVKQQQNAEYEKMQRELQKQRDEVERMKEELQRQQQTQMRKGHESMRQLEQERAQIQVWQQEEMKRQLNEVQRERELASKHEEEVRRALAEEQRVQQQRLIEQQNILREQQANIERKLHQDEATRTAAESRRLQEMRQKEEELAKRRADIEHQESRLEQEKKVPSQLASKQKEEFAKQQEELRRKNEEIVREKAALDVQRKAEEAARQEKRREIEAIRLADEKKLREQQELLKREQDMLDIQKKELKLQFQEARQSIDSLQPMRDLVSIINISGGSPGNSVSPSSIQGKKLPAKQAPLPPGQKPPAQVAQATVQVVRSPPPPRFPGLDLDAVIEGYKVRDVVRAQRAARRWLNRRKFRRIVALKLHATDPETENLKRRYRSVNEVYTTEFYFIPMEVEANVTKLFKSADIQRIFSNLRSLVTVSTDFLHDLEIRLHQFPIKVGDIFLKYAPIFKIYTEYVNNFETVTPKVTQLKETPMGLSFFNEQKQKSKVNADINTLLIMPVQRIPRYELLLREILSHTEADHVEYQSIKTAHESIKNINKYINERKRNVDNRSRLVELQKEIKNAPELMASHRYFVREGPCVISSTKKHESGNIYLLFFNDMILVTKKAGMFSSCKYEYLYSIPLLDSDVRNIESQDSMVRIVNGKLDSIDVVIYTLCFATKKEKDVWLSDLTSESTLKGSLVRIQSSASLGGI